MLSIKDNFLLYFLKVSCSVNMRPHLEEIHNDAVGCLFSVLFTTVSINEKPNLWEVAEATKGQLQGDVVSKAKGFMSMLKLIAKMNLDEAQALSRNNGRFLGLNLSYTNLGNCTFLDRDTSVQARIIGHVSGSSEHNMGPLFAHSAATILRRLQLNVLYFTSVHRDEVVEFYAGEIKRIINETIAQ